MNHRGGRDRDAQGSIHHPGKGNGFPSPPAPTSYLMYTCFLPHSPCPISGPSVFYLGISEAILPVYSSGRFQEQGRLCVSFLSSTKAGEGVQPLLQQYSFPAQGCSLPSRDGMRIQLMQLLPRLIWRGEKFFCCIQRSCQLEMTKLCGEGIHVMDTVPDLT